MHVDWSRPDFEKEELDAAYKSLETYIGGNGAQVSALECEFATFTGAKYAIAVCNGTAALLVALMCLKEKYGAGKIGVPSFTFIASANAAHHIYGHDNVILLDCNPDTWNIDSNTSLPDIDILLTVDVGGLSCDYRTLKKLDIPIIADSAESLGSTQCAEQVGSQADFHCYSLHRSKIVSCGEGGIITTNSAEFNQLARSFLNHGYDFNKKSYEYKHNHYGLNYRMSDVHAAIARVQLKKIEQYVIHRNKIAQIYKEELGNKFHYQNFDSALFQSNYFFFGILHKDRDKILRHLLHNHIDVKVWTAVHEQEIWKGYNLPNALRISRNNILLPIYNTIPEIEVEYVIQKLKEVV